jgi:hypothetical protein
MKDIKKFNPKRKLHAGFYWRVNLDWIKQEICKIYGYYDIERELIITEIKNSYGKTGTYLFSLMGSPPKGYALYIPTATKLILIGMSGEKIKKFKDILIEEIKDYDGNF